MGCGVVRDSAGLTRGRIADHVNLPESEVENVAHVRTAFSASAGYRAVLVTGIRQEKNASHCAVIDALLVSNYAALLRRVTVSVVVASII
jgi:hypothetical protein